MYTVYIQIFEGSKFCRCHKFSIFVTLFFEDDLPIKFHACHVEHHLSSLYGDCIWIFTVTQFTLTINFTTFGSPNLFMNMVPLNAAGKVKACHHHLIIAISHVFKLLSN